MHFSLLAAPLLTAFLLLLRVLPCFVAETLPAPLLSLPLCYLPWWPLPRESLPPLSPSRLFPLVLCTVHGHPHRTQSLESSSSSSLILNLYLYSPHLNTKRQKPRNGSLSVQTIPSKLPELLINLSSQGPHLIGAPLPALLRAVHHPGTIAMTDFRQRLSG